MIYLIDPEGKIKEKGLRREEMIEYINTLFEYLITGENGIRKFSPVLF